MFLSTLVFTNLEKKVYFRGPLVGAALSGLSVFGLLLFFGLSTWWLGGSLGGASGYAGGLLGALGYLTIFAAPFIGAATGFCSGVGACLATAPLKETVSRGKRALRAFFGSTVGLMVGVPILFTVLSWIVG